MSDVTAVKSEATKRVAYFMWADSDLRQRGAGHFTSSRCENDGFQSRCVASTRWCNIYDDNSGAGTTNDAMKFVGVSESDGYLTVLYARRVRSPRVMTYTLRKETDVVTTHFAVERRRSRKETEETAWAVTGRSSDVDVHHKIESTQHSLQRIPLPRCTLKSTQCRYRRAAGALTLALIRTP